MDGVADKEQDGKEFADTVTGSYRKRESLSE